MGDTIALSIDWLRARFHSRWHRRTSPPASHALFGLFVLSVVTPITFAHASAPPQAATGTPGPIRDVPGDPIGDGGELTPSPTAATFEIVDWDAAWYEPCPANTPSSRTVTLKSLSSSRDVHVALEIDTDWLVADPAILDLTAATTGSTRLTFNPARLPPSASYTVTIRLVDKGTFYTRTESIEVTLGGFCVTPNATHRTAAPVGGELSRSFAIYRLEHTGGDEAEPIDWVASTEDAWIQVGRSDPTAGRLLPGERTTVVVFLDPLTTPSASNTGIETITTGRVLFEDQSHSVRVEREITVEVVQPHLTVETGVVSADTVQPGGPAYSFLMGRYAVTNREFASFLNDARANLSTDRGAAMYFDNSTGDVYMHSAISGAMGDGAAEHTVKLLTLAEAPGIEFADGVYAPRTSPTDDSEHPITGVSWYGAVKFCNWLTIDQGLGLDARCYSEGTTSDLLGWRPLTVAALAWRSRDLNDAEARRLVETCTGFRLPMDDGFDNTNPTTDTADTFNEWFKTAAWNGTRRRNMLYGFGRDLLTTADANYRCSGDPFEPALQCQSGGTTPVGFFDGQTKEISGVIFTPRADENGFDLFDMTGNVHQWMQGRYAPSTVLDQRTLRGGSFNEPAFAASLKNTGRTLWASPSLTHREIGFRVVRSTAKSGDFNADGAIDFDDVPAISICLTGPNTNPRGGCQTADLTDDDDVDLHDLRTWLLNFNSEP